MQIRFIVFLLVTTVIVIFAAQNPTLISIKFLKFSFMEVPTSVLVLISMLAGAVVTAFFGFFSFVSLHSELRKKNSMLKKLASAAENDPAQGPRADEQEKN